MVLVEEVDDQDHGAIWRWRIPRSRHVPLRWRTGKGPGEHEL